MDETSGLFNRKYMNFYLEKAHKTNPRQLYGIMMDVNDFKKINDRYGHSMGDRAIREIGKILSASLRRTLLPSGWRGMNSSSC